MASTRVKSAEPSPPRSPTGVRAASQRDSAVALKATSRSSSAWKRQVNQPWSPGAVPRSPKSSLVIT